MTPVRHHPRSRQCGNADWRGMFRSDLQPDHPATSWCPMPPAAAMDAPSAGDRLNAAPGGRTVHPIVTARH